MITKSVAYHMWCQGHGGRCECAWIEGFGLACDGQCDVGVVSYCDNSCASAQDQAIEAILNHQAQAPADSTDSITLQAHTDAASWLVTFEGTDAQRWALAYMAARPKAHFEESVLHPFSLAVFPELAAKLHPICHHGMSAHLCMDPYGEHHFGTREQEMACGW